MVLAGFIQQTWSRKATLAEPLAEKAGLRGFLGAVNWLSISSNARVKRLADSSHSAKRRACSLSLVGGKLIFERRVASHGSFSKLTFQGIKREGAVIVGLFVLNDAPISASNIELPSLVF